MTDNEIIKALECCANATHKDCKNCPLFVVDGCVKTMSTNALDLINRQQVEIERLKNQVNRLKKYDERRDIALHSRLIAEARAEAIKEFAERLKEELLYCVTVIEGDGAIVTNLGYEKEDVNETIDNLIKEMVGEE